MYDSANKRTGPVGPAYCECCGVKLSELKMVITRTRQTRKIGLVVFAARSPVRDRLWGVQLAGEGGVALCVEHRVIGAGQRRVAAHDGDLGCIGREDGL